MTNSEARKRRAEAVPHDHAERVPGCFRCDLSAEDEIAHLTTERDEAVAEVRDYRRALDFGIACISCARTLEDMHALEAQVAAVAALADDLVGDSEPAGYDLEAALTDPATVLARRDAEVAARALREAADEYGTPGMAAATPYVIDWLNDRANRIEKGEQG